jgi:hypothetical protein
VKSLFEKLIHDGAPAVRALNGQSEGLDFDCKCKKTPGNGSFEKEDRQNLGKALSAFANSMGGLLLWGVDARRDAISGLDVVRDFHPITDLRRFESEAHALSSEALMPRINNVAIEAIEEPVGSGVGYLAIYVERSDRRPHYCQVKDVRGYYRRALSSSRMMEHFEIEDAFKRFQVPELELGFLLYGGGMISAGALPYPVATIGFELPLKNTSDVSAMFP